jgi:hypothetical protein
VETLSVHSKPAEAGLLLFAETCSFCHISLHWRCPNGMTITSSSSITVMEGCVLRRICRSLLEMARRRIVVRCGWETESSMALVWTSSGYWERSRMSTTGVSCLGSVAVG